MAQIEELKIFTKGINKDVDPRFLQEGEYIDADNIMINDAVSGKVGVVYNMRNTAIRSTTSLYNTSDSKIIGLFSDPTNNEIYTFIAHGNSDSYHRIIKYNINSGTHSVVVVSSNLPWTINTRIKSFDVIDGILFWTDGENEPMMFNQNLDYLTIIGISEYSVSGTYNVLGVLVHYNNIIYERNGGGAALSAPSGDLSDNTYWDVHPQDSITQDYLTIAKVAPSNKPLINVYADEFNRGNNIIGRFFQFKHRFIFKDNSKSVFSPVSNVAYSIDDYLLPADNSAFNNAISIDIPSSGANRMVESVELAVRSGNKGDWYSVGIFDASSLIDDGNINVLFYNNGIYETIALNEASQIFSDVPRSSGTQVYANNRLIFGNCKTGYDKDTVLSLDISLVHGSAILSLSSTYNTSDLSPVLTLQGLKDFFLSANNYTPKFGDKIRFQGDNPTNPPFGDLTIEISAGMGVEDIFDRVSEARFLIGTRSLKWDGTYIGDYDEDDRIIENDHLTITITPSGSAHQPTLKSGSWYNLGYQYFDEFGRTNGTIYDDGNKFYVPSIGERYIVEDVEDDKPSILIPRGSTRGVGATSALIIFDHQPPVWAKYYSIVYSRTKTSSLSEYLVVTGAASDGNGYQLTLGSYDDFQDRFPATSFSYDFVKGDRLRFITKGYTAAAATDDWVDDVYDYEITKVDTSAGLVISAYIPASDMTLGEVDNSLIEIYRPGREREEDESIFYESSKVYPIENGHGGTVKQDLTGTSGSSDSVFSLVYTFTGKFQYMKMRLAGSSGFPKSFFQDGASGSLVISDIVVDQSIYPIWTSSLVFNNGDKCQYNGVIWEWTGGSGTTGEPGVAVNWEFPNDLIGSYDIEYVQILESDYFYMRVTDNSGDGWNGLAGDWGAANSLGVESCSVTYETNDKGIILFDDGDAYYRTRNLLETDAVTYTDRGVESFSISDFRESKHANIGRPSAIINQQEEQRYATLMYSEPYIPNTEINNLNNVYPDENFEEYNRNFGSIIHISDEGNHILMLQEDKISKVLIDQSIMYDAQGGANYLGTESQVLSRAIPLPGEYGIQDFRSFISVDQGAYAVDLERGAIIRITDQGVEEISRLGMYGHFTNLCKQTLRAADQSIIGMYDPLNGEYIVRFVNEDEVWRFHEGADRWISRGSLFDPVFSTYLNNSTFFAKSNGTLNEINGSGFRNYNGSSFVDSYIQFSSNIDPFTLKNYLAIIINGSYPVDVQIITEGINGESSQVSTLDKSLDFRQREQVYEAAFLRDSNTPGVALPLINGDTMKGDYAKIKLTLTGANIDEEWYINAVKLIISKG